jgi:hypothetical protein
MERDLFWVAESKLGVTSSDYSPGAAIPVVAKEPPGEPYNTELPCGFIGDRAL